MLFKLLKVALPRSLKSGCEGRFQGSKVPRFQGCLETKERLRHADAVGALPRPARDPGSSGQDVKPRKGSPHVSRYKQSSGESGTEESSATLTRNPRPPGPQTTTRARRHGTTTVRSYLVWPTEKHDDNESLVPGLLLLHHPGSHLPLRCVCCWLIG